MYHLQAPVRTIAVGTSFLCLLVFPRSLDIAACQLSDLWSFNQSLKVSGTHIWMSTFLIKIFWIFNILVFYHRGLQSLNTLRDSIWRKTLLLIKWKGKITSNKLFKIKHCCPYYKCHYHNKLKIWGPRQNLMGAAFTHPDHGFPITNPPIS